MKQNSLLQSNVVQQVNEINGENLNQFEAINAIDGIFKATVAQKYGTIMQAQAANWKTIIAEYEPASQELLQQQFYAVLLQIHPGRQSKGLQINSLQSKALIQADEGGGTCDPGYDLCVAGVLLQQALCNIACDSLTLGWGTIPCYAACALIAISENASCANSYHCHS